MNDILSYGGNNLVEKIKNKKKKCQNSVFVRQVEFRDFIPQFESLRNNMAFEVIF